MTFTEFLATLITFGAVLVAQIWAVVWYLGTRIERIEERIDGGLDKFDGRLSSLEEKVQLLREDVAVLKATRD